MKRKYFWWILLIVVLGGAIYAYKEFNRQKADLRDVSPKFQLTARELLDEFSRDEAAASKKYQGLNVVLAVEGMVKGTEKDSNGNYTILLGDTSGLSSVRCTIDSMFTQQAASVVSGSHIMVKGYFNGYKPDELGIGADVEMNLCIIDNKKN